MRKKLIALTLSVCMILGGVNTTTYAKTKTNILQNNDDTYTLENYASSLKEVQEIKLNNLLENTEGKYKITVDSDVDWIDDVRYTSCRNELDDGLGVYYYNGGVSCGWDDVEELTDNTGKKYTVFTMHNVDYVGFAKQRKELLNVRDKFLATMPNLDEMSDYEKVLGILSFMSYIKYGFDEKGNTIDDAYTALVEGKSTCTGYANAFNFLAKTIDLNSIEVHSSNHSWNAIKICGKWYELEPQSKNNPSSADAVRNINMTTVLRGTDTMLTMGPSYSKANTEEGDFHYVDARATLPISNIDYMDYKGHDYTNHTIKWDGNKATFYRTCSECGEYENDGFEYDEKNKLYNWNDSNWHLSQL